MAIPKHEELFKDVLQALMRGEHLSSKEMCDVIAKRRNISDEERAVTLKSGNAPVFKNRVDWARTYLKAAGLVEYPQRGIASITDEGRKVLKEDPQPFDTKYLRKYESFRVFMSPKSKDGNAEPSEGSQQEQTPGERMEAAFSQINEVLKGEILSEIMSQGPAFFERLVIKLLMAMGYGGTLDGEGVVTPRSGDGGIDGVIREDKLGFSNIYIQAKRYALDQTVGRPEVQGFIGAIANKSGKGLFITTAKFSSVAVQCAKENHVVLVNGDKLAELMIEYSVGVSTLQKYEIKKLDSDFFMEQD